MSSTGKEGGTKVAALYIRVSTLDQAREGYSLAAYQSVDNRGFNLPAVPAGGTNENGVAVGNDFTSDVRVRRALNIGVDRQEMIDNVLNGYGRPPTASATRCPGTTPPPRWSTTPRAPPPCWTRPAGS